MDNFKESVLKYQVCMYLDYEIESYKILRGKNK